MTRTLAVTLIESLGLIIWLALAQGAGTVLGAIVVLAGFLTLEHAVAYNNLHGRSLFSFHRLPLKRLGIVSISEAIIWAIWLVLAGTMTYSYGVGAAVVLAALLIIQHNLEFNVVEGQGLLKNVAASRSVGISVIEAVTGAVWLALVATGNPISAVIVLVVGLQIEHVIQAKKVEIRKILLPLPKNELPF